jgi:tetratricopeptide (TPR) repeat protein
MAIKGSLKEASLADVLQLLSLGQKSGCLSVADRNQFGYIYFERGKICYASIVNRRDRLGDIMVKAGKISQEQLDSAIAQQSKDRGKRVGEILVEQNALSRETLETQMRYQIEEAVYFLFTWTQGSFNFESDVRPDPQDFLVSINPESLLLEGARRVDEWSLIEKKIPSFDLIFSIDHDRLQASQVQLTAEQQHLLPLFDGARDVARVIEDSGMGDFDVGKSLYGLITAGFAHRTGRSRSSQQVAVDDIRMQEHRNLGMAFFKTGMLDEAAKEFRKVLELRATDGGASFYLGLIAVKQARWSDAVQCFRHAAERLGAQPSVLHNLAYAYEQSGSLGEAEAAYAEAAARGGTDTRILVGWAIVALQRGDFQGAQARLDRVKELTGERQLPELWFWARSLAAAGQEAFDEAETYLRKGLQAYPKSAVLRNNLAALLELLGEVEHAEEVLRDVLSDEPALAQVSKNLGDILYRTGRHEEAWEAYQRAVKMSPALGDDVYFKLGNIAFKRGDRDRAGSLWKTVLGMNPQHQLAKSNLDTIEAGR